MDFKALGWTDYAVMTAVIIIILGLFLKFAVKTTTTLAEYIWGGRELGVWTIAGSLIATNVSGVAFFTATEIYLFGVNIVFESIGILLMIFIIRLQAQVLCDLKLTSLNEYVTLRYCKKVQIFASVVSTFIMIWSLITIGYSTAIIFSQLNTASMMTNAIAIFASGYLLSALSGFTGVVWTDAVQTVALFFTLITLIIYGLIRVDSVRDIMTLAREGGRFDIDWSLDPTIRLTFWSSILGYGLQYIMIMSLVSPPMYQRYCALPDQKSVNKVAVIHIIGVIFSRLTTCCLGYIMYALYAKCDPLLAGQVEKYDQVLAFFLQDISNGKTFIQGVFITGYTCAAFSTLTTLINTLSITTYKDFLEDTLNPNKNFIKAKRYIRLVGFLVTLVCCFAIHFLEHAKTTIIELTTYSVFLPAMHITIIMTGIFLPRINSKCVFWGAAIGFIFAVTNEIGRHSYERSPPIKMMKTDGCTYNVTLNSPLLEPESRQMWYLFKISPFYQFPMYCAVNTLIMLVASFFVGRKDYSKLDKKLISPLVRPYLSTVSEVSVPLSPSP